MPSTHIPLADGSKTDAVAVGQTAAVNQDVPVRAVTAHDIPDVGLLELKLFLWGATGCQKVAYPLTGHVGSGIEQFVYFSLIPVDGVTVGF